MPVCPVGSKSLKFRFSVSSDSKFTHNCKRLVYSYFIFEFQLSMKEKFNRANTKIQSFLSSYWTSPSVPSLTVIDRGHASKK